MTHLTKLRGVINKAVRVMAFKNRYESPKPLYNYHELLLLETNKKLNQGKFIWNLYDYIYIYLINNLNAYKPFIALYVL